MGRRAWQRHTWRRSFNGLLVVYTTLEGTQTIKAGVITGLARLHNLSKAVEASAEADADDAEAGAETVEAGAGKAPGHDEATC